MCTEVTFKQAILGSEVHDDGTMYALIPESDPSIFEKAQTLYPGISLHIWKPAPPHPQKESKLLPSIIKSRNFKNTSENLLHPPPPPPIPSQKKTTKSCHWWSAGGRELGSWCGPWYSYCCAVAKSRGGAWLSFLTKPAAGVQCALLHLLSAVWERTGVTSLMTSTCWCTWLQSSHYLTWPSLPAGVPVTHQTSSYQRQYTQSSLACPFNYFYLLVFGTH